jgi:3-oxoacyl-[acyl-carrier protein] reductase
MDLGLKGKRAVVLGGTRGIGRAIANVLGEEGAAVALCARKAEEVKAAVGALQGVGVKAYGEAVDVADGAALRAFVANAAEALGGIDIAISNASALVRGTAPEDWQHMLDVDILALVGLVEAAEPFLEEAAVKSGDAVVLAISSISAMRSSSPSAYGATKAALIHLMKGYARSLAAKKIRANTISPGTIYFEDGVWGRMEREQPEVYKRSLAANPLGRMGRPEEVADAAAFLASPRSAYTTGANLAVDGTMTDHASI